jgi:hypothetical protein
MGLDMLERRMRETLQHRTVIVHFPNSTEERRAYREAGRYRQRQSLLSDRLCHQMPNLARSATRQRYA